jgi:ketosteroid isomerase-like protein
MPTRADDELEIMRLLARLAQAVDDRDADAYRDCLADEVVCLVPGSSPDEVWRAVPGEAYARQAVESVSGFDWTHHRLCNFVIVIDGERAHGKVDVVAQMQVPKADDGGAPPRLTVGGRYDLEFGKVATEWRITKRHMKTRYTVREG